MKAIIFDVGNVLLDFDNHLFISGIKKYSPYSHEDLWRRVYDDSDVNRRFNRGDINADQFYEEVCLLSQADMDKDEFVDAFASRCTKNQEVFALVRELSDEYLLGMLSNTNSLDAQIIRNIEIFDLFDAATFSFEVGVRKPEAAMYHDIARRLGVQPEECLFIDDKAQNVQGARNIGMHAIRCTGSETISVQLREFLKEKR